MSVTYSRDWLVPIRRKAAADGKLGSPLALRVLSACERIEAMSPEHIWDSDLITLASYVHEDWRRLAEARIAIVGHTFHLDQVIKVSLSLCDASNQNRADLVRDLILHAAHGHLFDDIQTFI